MHATLGSCARTLPASARSRSLTAECPLAIGHADIARAVLRRVDELTMETTSALPTFTSTGARDDVALRRAIDGRRFTVWACAERLVPPATGKLTVSFTIAAAGRVADVVVAGIAGVEECARRAIAKWDFGGGGAASVTVTLEITKR